jgi:hypothetical protein
VANSFQLKLKRRFFLHSGQNRIIDEVIAIRKSYEANYRQTNELANTPSRTATGISFDVDALGPNEVINR